MRPFYVFPVKIPNTGKNQKIFFKRHNEVDKLGNQVDKS